MNVEKDITIIIPSYNTKEYTIMAYSSIRKYYPSVKIIILDDGSRDGSQEWLNAVSIVDFNLVLWYNTNGSILGHTVTYDRGIGMATTKLVTIFHSDMVMGKNYLENLLKYWLPHTVVTATRIEPEGIYPPGREKILKPFGIEAKDFKQTEFDSFVEEEQKSMNNASTRGIFAPWLISKEDFITIGGHDALHYAPYPEEDADLFLRFALAGYELIQSRSALCWHWISRGHRSWATNGVGKDDNMFQFYQTRARRNYLRKWHRWMQFDEFRYPQIHKVYDTAFVVRDVTMPEFLHAIEPWATCTYVDNWDVAKTYIGTEQPTTKLLLNGRRLDKLVDGAPIPHDVVLEFSQKDFMANGQENLGIIHNLSALIADSAEPNSKMELGIFKLTTHDLKDLAPSMVKL